jgi:hypothetical protein
MVKDFYVIGLCIDAEQDQGLLVLYIWNRFPPKHVIPCGHTNQVDRDNMIISMFISVLIEETEEKKWHAGSF